MSAVPRHFTGEHQAGRETDPDESRDAESGDDAESPFWHWLALAALLFGWIAEATMCAERGF